jgi:hypothetical protein
MTPRQVIAGIDTRCAQYGEQVTFTRYTGQGSGRTVQATATTQAVIVPYGAKELIGGIIQGDVRVIFSPTGLNAAGWPNGAQSLVAGDQFSMRGRIWKIQSIDMRMMGTQPVRFELQVRG